jgi:HK97 family phage major capsid protein
MTFEIPKITAVPTVTVENEEGALSETGMTNSFLSVNVKKYSGMQTFTWELLDRSSPAFYDELVRQMEYAYALATDEAVITALGVGATDGGNRTFDASGLLGFAADGAGSIYSNSLGFAQSLVVSPAAWSKIMGLNDAGRPIYNALNPQNAAGQVTPQSLQGNVAGLNLYVSRNLAGVGDNSMFIVNPQSYTWYESARLALRTNVIGTGQIEVAYYGYGAIATKVAAGAYKFMVA